MSNLARRNGAVWLKSGTALQVAASYYVNVYPVGGKASAGSLAGVITLYAGHGFRTGDKILLNPGASQVYSGAATVDSWNATSITMTAGSYTVTAGDVIFNLGEDTSIGSTPNWDGSPIKIYDDPTGSGTAISNSRLTTDSSGRYTYWSHATGAWELHRTGNTPVGYEIGTMVGTEINPHDYGAVGDGAVDDTKSVMSSIYAAMGSGGAVQFRPLTYLISGAITFPNDGGTPPRQKPCRLLGVGCNYDTPEATGGQPVGGTILDMRYDTAPAKIDTRGSGHLEIGHIAFIDEGAHTTPFIQTTNTMLWVHDCSFNSQSTKSGADGTCDQDAIILGGIDTTIDGSSDAPYQGYGTVIERCYFNRIRRGVYVRRYANGPIVRDCVWWAGCGATTAAAAIEIDGQSATPAQGGLYVGNIIEVMYYAYGIKVTRGFQNNFYGNGFYDPGAGTVAYIRFESGSTGNTVIHGQASVGSHTEVATSDAAGTNAVLVATANTLVAGSPGTAGVGLKGVSTAGVGLYGLDSTTGIGVAGGAAGSNGAIEGTNTSTGPGVKGTSTSGIGVHGTVNNSSQAVQATQAGSGIGLYSTVQAGMGLTIASTGGNFADFQRGNGCQWKHCATTELITVAAAAASDSSAYLLPDNCIIDAVVARVTVAITCTSTFDIGDDSGSAATRFATGVSKAANTTKVGLDHWTGTIAAVNGTDRKIRITPDATPSDATGRVRVTVYYREFVPPTS